MYGGEGVEPLSEDNSTKVSMGVVTVLMSPNKNSLRPSRYRLNTVGHPSIHDFSQNGRHVCINNDCVVQSVVHFTLTS